MKSSITVFSLTKQAVNKPGLCFKKSKAGTVSSQPAEGFNMHVYMSLITLSILWIAFITTAVLFQQYNVNRAILQDVLLIFTFGIGTAFLFFLTGKINGKGDAKNE